MDPFIDIYSHRAEAYHRMIAPEDADGALLPALERNGPLRGKRVLDLGSGSGRIPLLARDREARVAALDLHRAMLLEQARQREAVGGHWPLIQGDLHDLPAATGWADLTVAGWAIGHQVGWRGERWPEHIDRMIEEMARVTRRGGEVIIFETLSTGSLTPMPPSEGLAAYYARLEQKWGFEREVLATDYQFESVAQAVEATEFFFGAEMANRIRKNGWARVPEWTGVWRKVI